MDAALQGLRLGAIRLGDGRSPMESSRPPFPPYALPPVRSKHLAHALSQTARDASGVTARTALACLFSSAALAFEVAFTRLRADLVSGALPPVAWTLQDWLTRTLQGLTAGWLD